MIEVKMTWFELISIGQMSVMRSIQHIKDGERCPKHKNASLTDPMAHWGYAAFGMMGEAAVAKYIDSYWSGGTPRIYTEPDVGKNIEVRTTAVKSAHLIVYADDKDDAPYILVIAALPIFILVGWLPGRECKASQHWRENGVRSPAFFVPQSALKPIKELFI